MALDRLCERAEDAVRARYNIIILSDRLMARDRVAIPAVLATAGVHNHLIRKGLRTSVGLVVESGEPREVHHFCVLAGYGAEAINPYLAFDTLMAMKAQFPEEVDEDEIVYRYIKSIDKGILKVMSKMGISTYQSYCGAQIFDAVGLKSSFVDEYFFGTATTVEGVGLDEITADTMARHTAAFGDDPVLANQLEVGGEYAYRQRGEAHAWTPDVVAGLQHAVRTGLPEKYLEYAAAANAETARNALVASSNPYCGGDGRMPVPLDEVEPAEAIVRRFNTGAMSFGSISREAHETLAIAMNRIGGKSNTARAARNRPDSSRCPTATPSARRSSRSPPDASASPRSISSTPTCCRSRSRRAPSRRGRSAAGPQGRCGHRQGPAFDAGRGPDLTAAASRHLLDRGSGAADLRPEERQPAADISVKLVSEVGVGTVAAGVAKARADHITISGYDGGTGASPLTSIKHAGSPWEIGLAETHQTLVMNGLRSRVCLQVDGGFKTGRDVIVGALLGADDFGFSTAPLIAAGCLMMRKCHLNTCPVGIATQDPVLRKRFKARPSTSSTSSSSSPRSPHPPVGDGLPHAGGVDRPVRPARPGAPAGLPKAAGLDFRRLFFKPDAPRRRSAGRSARTIRSPTSSTAR